LFSLQKVGGTGSTGLAIFFVKYSRLTVSEVSRIYGCIVGPHGTLADWYGLYPLNRAAVRSLPTRDQYPPLTRRMFTVPMDYAEPGAAFFREQIVHFGASFNHLSEFWHLGLVKFETLLRQLYWSEARVHLHMELKGDYDYQWLAARDQKAPPWLCSPPEPTMEWEFSGGPRDFRVV
jgi:hypothetical protein